MKEELYRLLAEEGGFRKFEEIEFDEIDAVFGSPEQIYGIAIFETEEQMNHGWERAAEELVVKIQAQLKGQLKSLRWDIYLILLVTNGDVQVSTRKIIENDRNYFRKIVLTSQDRKPEDRPFADRLPFLLKIDPDKSDFLMFGDIQFLQELKQCLLPTSVARMGEDFFAGKSNERTLHRLLIRSHTDGGENQ